MDYGNGRRTGGVTSNILKWVLIIGIVAVVIIVWNSGSETNGLKQQLNDLSQSHEELKLAYDELALKGVTINNTNVDNYADGATESDAQEAAPSLEAYTSADTPTPTSTQVSVGLFDSDGESDLELSSIPFAETYYDGNRDDIVDKWDYVLMGGVRYDEPLSYYASWGDTTYSLHNLNSEYSLLTGEIGHVDDSDNEPGIFEFFADGKPLASYELKPDELPVQISLDVTDVKLLKITYYVADYGVSYAFGNAVLEK